MEDSRSNPQCLLDERNNGSSGSEEIKDILKKLDDLDADMLRKLEERFLEENALPLGIQTIWGLIMRMISGIYCSK